MNRNLEKIACYLIFLFIFSAVTAGCTTTEKVTAVDKIDERVADANLNFAMDLYSHITQEEDKDNVFISPASIFVALSMTYQGAGNETKEEMAEVLGYADIPMDELNRANADLLTVLDRPDEGVNLNLANSIWKRQELDFYEEFLESNQQYYDAEVQALDFNDPQASETINSWVEEKTEGKIEDIVDDDIDPDTVMFLINALHFEADWTEPFDPDHTQDRTFNLPDGESTEVPMMYRDDEMQYLETDEFQAVRLPYGENKRVGMYVFLPAEEVEQKDFVNQLSAENWDSWLSEFDEQEGILHLPKFEMEYELDLRDHLINMGMDTAFDESRANFENMRPIPPNLYLKSVQHKTFVETDEKGTEAAAATSVEVGIESATEQFQMEVNRPFFFTIYDDVTQTILFMGHINNP